jgi:hypothetical protein
MATTGSRMERIVLPEQPELTLEYESGNHSESGPCPHCGQMTSRVWGYVYRFDLPLAAYFVEWTPGHSENEATFDLIVGRWGEDAHAAGREAVSVGFRVLESGPAFMVQDAAARRVGSSSLVSKALSRNEVIGSPLANDVFLVCDLIYLADPRIEKLRN